MEAFGKCGAAAASAARASAPRKRGQESLQRIVALLKARGGFFDTFSPEVLIEVAQRLELRDAPAGALLLREGEVSNELYVIASGKVRIYRDEGGASQESPSKAATEARIGDPRSLLAPHGSLTKTTPSSSAAAGTATLATNRSRLDR